MAILTSFLASAFQKSHGFMKLTNTTFVLLCGNPSPSSGCGEANAASKCLSTSQFVDAPRTDVRIDREYCGGER